MIGRRDELPKSKRVVAVEGLGLIGGLVVAIDDAILVVIGAPLPRQRVGRRTIVDVIILFFF